MSRAQHILAMVEDEKKSIHPNSAIRSRIKDSWASKGIHPTQTRLQAYPTPKKRFQKRKKTERIKSLYKRHGARREKTKNIYKGN